MTLTPVVDERVYDIAPDFKAVSVVVSCEGVAHHAQATDFLQQAVANLNANNPAWADDHLDAWANVFRRFGAKPQRTPCSAGALRKRAMRSGGAPSINPIVDVYNAVSLMYAVPVGGEDLTAYSGAPRLTVANGAETFETMRNGEAAIESPDKGEVIWRDDDGVTCRRWNWRQCVRTQIKSGTTDMWFILEALSEMPADALYDAADTLQATLSTVLKNARFASTPLEGGL